MLVYKGFVRSSEGVKEYIGQTMRTFKDRLYKHRHSFKEPKRMHDTTLATYVWALKNRNIDYSVDYTLVRPADPYMRGDKACKLCLMEKTFIATNHHQDSLNKRSELLQPCEHKLQHRLDNYHGPPQHHPTWPNGIVKKNLSIQFWEKYLIYAWKIYQLWRNL